MTDQRFELERSDLLVTLDQHRSLFRRTVSGISDEQAAQRTTVSELCLGGLIKHVALVEAGWARFIDEGPAVMAWDPGKADERAEQFQMSDGDTLAGLLAEYDRVAQSTNRLVMSVPSLDDSQPLPEAPWFPPGTRWTARRVFLHIIAETAQHAGHADIIREAIDGSKTMG